MSAKEKKMTKNDEKNLEIIMWRLFNNGPISVGSEIVKDSKHIVDELIAHGVVCTLPDLDFFRPKRIAIRPDFLTKYCALRVVSMPLSTPLDLLDRLGVIRISPTNPDSVEFVEVKE
jgi:hypothetical protein